MTRPDQIRYAIVLASGSISVVCDRHCPPVDELAAVGTSRVSLRASDQRPCHVCAEDDR